MLNPQAQKILNILQDRNWHCPQEWGYADGHCKRITDINKYLFPQDLKIDSKVCDCGNHNGKVFKRRIVLSEPHQTPNPAPRPIKKTHALYDCPSWNVFKVYCPDCRQVLQQQTKVKTLF